jgi:hypothetical protein
MTEAEWLACGNPEEMYRFLGDRLSERKTRLYLCACCRRIKTLLFDTRASGALRVAERYADGKAGASELAAAERWATKAAIAASAPELRMAYYAVRASCSRSREEWLSGAGYVAHALGATGLPAFLDSGLHEVQMAVLAEVFREVITPPWRSMKCEASWKAWEGGVIVAMASAVYDEGAFDRLPILADALEEAGCADEAILSHLRGPGSHARGCWAIDLLLGKS